MAVSSLPTGTGSLADYPRDTPWSCQRAHDEKGNMSHTIEEKVVAQVLAHHGVVHDLGHLVLCELLWSLSLGWLWPMHVKLVGLLSVIVHPGYQGQVLSTYPHLG
jgi:hypothetical protein